MTNNYSLLQNYFEEFMIADTSASATNSLLTNEVHLNFQMFLTFCFFSTLLYKVSPGTNRFSEFCFIYSQ